MENSVLFIPVAKLAFAFIPVLAVIVILYKWSLNHRNSIYAISRMLLQLLIIGYLLTYIFESNSILIIVAVLAIMLFASSWIALRTIGTRPLVLLKRVLYAIGIGGGINLFLITQLVLDLQPWYWPRYFIPLAGMIFANAMNSVSLAAERLQSEIEREVPYEEARAISLRASLIPITNSLFAVGLVALPGMMTGQILSGISPLLAVRYQIMVMCMIYSSAGISSFFFLSFVRNYLNEFKMDTRVMASVDGKIH